AVRDATGLSLNTVKNHWFACYQTAVASLSVEVLLRGSTTSPGPTRPSRDVLLTADRWSDVPASWRPEGTDDQLEWHFRARSLELARLRRRNPEIMRAVEATPIPGHHVLDFLSAGSVTVIRARTCQFRVGGDAEAA
ncbi:MAG: hypothetical protein JWO56_2606, partial [Acidobacteria bacterium]|nr:hypothetical protein [Acidobacteriota bacterium]